MALVTRPPKQGGFLSYAAKVAAGFTKILSAELDADIQAVIAQVNGFLDATNILPASIVSSLLATGAVTAAKLAPGVAVANLQPNTVPGADLVDQSVTLAKLGLNASTNIRTNTQDNTSAFIGTSAGLLAELSFTSRGGLVEADFSVGGQVSVAPSLPSLITVQLYEDGTPATADGTVVRAVTISTGVIATQVPWWVHFRWSNTALAAGTHRYKLFASCTTASSYVKQHVEGLVIEHA